MFNFFQSESEMERWQREARDSFEWVTGISGVTVAELRFNLPKKEADKWNVTCGVVEGKPAWQARYENKTKPENVLTVTTHYPQSGVMVAFTIEHHGYGRRGHTITVHQDGSADVNFGPGDSPTRIDATANAFPIDLARATRELMETDLKLIGKK